MVNDLWLMLIGPILFAGTAGFIWLLNYFFGDCRHKWGTWEREKDTEFCRVQSRTCKKCGYNQVEQVRK
jgi:hypothetical protein